MTTYINNAGLENKVDLIYLFQTFATGGGYSMPTLADIQNWPYQFLNTNALDGFLYYMWGSWYNSDLQDYPNYWPEMININNFIFGTGVSPSPTTSPTKPGDANSDGKVDGIDYVIWLNHYLQSVTGVINGDFNNDNKVDGIDYIIWLNNYGQ